MPGKFSCTAKFRYRQTDTPVEVEILPDGRAHITFAEPVRAITQDKLLFSTMEKNVWVAEQLTKSLKVMKN